MANGPCTFSKILGADIFVIFTSQSVRWFVWVKQKYFPAELTENICGKIVNSLAGLGRHKADKGVMSEGAAPSSYLVTLFMLYKNDQCSRIKFLSGSKICFSCPIRKLYFHQSEPEIDSIYFIEN